MAQHYSNATKAWNEAPFKLQKKHFDSAQEFYLAFETVLFDYNASCTRKGVPRPSDAEITRKFVSSLPPGILARTRESASDVDTSTYETYRNKIANVWTANKESGIRINVAGAERTSPSAKRAAAEDEDFWEEADVRAAKRNFLPPRPAAKAKCMLSWEGAPKSLQGPIYYQEWMSPQEERFTRERHEKVKAANVCARCRLPRSKGHLQDTFTPVEPFKKPSVRVVTEQEEVDSQLQEEELED
ncbi:hypothetical protein OQA88_13242 [Cercophora sp. LCS_1]